MTVNPFLDDTTISDQLYLSAARLEKRTGALRAAKVHGREAAVTIADLVVPAAEAGGLVLDLGTGTGGIARHLARRFATTSVVALDRSAALARTARHPLDGLPNTAGVIRGDFHHLPARSASVRAVVAAFCLYHSRHPTLVVAEVARVLGPSGRLVAATKSADSYHELDELVARSGLDTGARRRASLYETFNTDNAEDVVASGLRIDEVRNQRHVFRFADLDHLGAYLATSPKYHIDAELVSDPRRLAGELRRRLPARAFTMTSTVTFVAAARP